MLKNKRERERERERERANSLFLSVLSGFQQIRWCPSMLDKGHSFLLSPLIQMPVSSRKNLTDIPRNNGLPVI
jgi:hypothetical protein